MVIARHTLDDARVIHKEAASLHRAGHEVFVLARCTPSWAYTALDGRVIAQGLAGDGRTELAGLQVRGLPKPAGPMGRLTWARDMARLGASIAADVYHAHEPDLAIWIARRAKRLLARRGVIAAAVHDIHEYPPGPLVNMFPAFAAQGTHALARAWDRRMLDGCDHVFTANTIVRGYALTLRYDLSASTLFNSPPLALFPQFPIDQWAGPPSPLVIVHEGWLGLSRGLREMLDVVDRLRGRVRLRIVGQAFGRDREWLQREIARRGLAESVEETGWLPYSQVGEALRQGHAGLILFRSTMQNRLAGPPNKLFNYMNAGLPVISVDLPEARRIVVEEGCGIILERDTADGIVEGLERLMANPSSIRRMGESGQAAIRQRYSWEQMEKVLFEDYARLERMLHGRRDARASSRAELA